MPTFAFEDTTHAVSDAQLLTDIRRVAFQLDSSTLPQRTYRQYGRYSTTVIKKRFGTSLENLQTLCIDCNLGKADLP